MAEELEVKVEETVAQTETETTENKKDANGRTRRPRRDGNRRPEKVSDGLEKRMVNLNAISKVTKGGKTMRYDALMVVGDKNGRVGIGMAKALDVTQAIEKATLVAKKHMITVCTDGTTIPHDIIGKFGTTKVIMMPSPEGKGIIAGGAVRAVLELAGIHDILSKSLGSRTKNNMANATLNALRQLKTPEHVAELRGKTVEEILG